MLTHVFHWARKSYRRFEFRHVTRWRLELGEHETQNLIPFFQIRIDEAVKALEKLITDCDKHRNDESFGAAYLHLVDGSGLGRASGKIPSSGKVAAQMYFDQVKEITSGTLTKAKLVQKNFAAVTDIASYAKAIAGLTEVCYIFENSKETAFAVTPMAILSFTNLKTGEVQTHSLNELQVVNFPFKNISENLALLGQTTRETIELWTKEQLEWKSRYVKVRYDV